MDYEQRVGHPPDFEVRYRFYTPEEGGRRTGPPFQHYRSAWSYDGDDVYKDGIYEIWPEFISEEGVVLPSRVQVPPTGRATMWILSHEMRIKAHRARVRVGVKGFFMEGPRRVAEATVTRLVALHSNSDGRSEAEHHHPAGARKDARR